MAARKLTAVTKDATPPAEISTPIELKDHPAHVRIDLANEALYQLEVLTAELLELVASNQEESFVPMALAARARKLARVACRSLTEPAKDFNLEQCEAEVNRG